MTDTADFDAVFDTAGEGTDLFDDPADYNPWAGPVRMRRGRYSLPHPDTGKPALFTRVSNVKDVLDDTYTLDRWKERTLAKGVGMRQELARLAVATPLDDRKTFAEIIDKARDAAGGNTGSLHGTAFHSFTEYADRREPLPEGTDEEIAGQIAQYRIALEVTSVQVLPHWIERVLWNRQHNIVGRCDRAFSVDLDALRELYESTDPKEPWWVEATGRAYIIGDTKSQKTMEYSNVGIAIQLADYSRADKVWNEQDGRWEDLDIELNRDVAIVMHTPSNAPRCDIQLINLRVGKTLLDLAMSVRKSRNEKVNRLLVSIDETRWFDAILNASTTDELSKIWQEANGRGEWNKILEAFGRRRQLEIEGGQQPTTPA